MNNTRGLMISEIFLLGFQNLQSWKIPFFLLLLIIYCTSISGNLLIITAVAFCKTLRSPMYVLLAQLSVSDMMLTTDIVPIALISILRGGLHMSISDCMTQFYIFGASGASGCLILTVMAYDRYMAICNPLRYSSIMNFTLLLILSIVSWLSGFFFISITAVNILTLDFCGPNTINHFFCDLLPILQLSCSDTSTVKTLNKYMSFPCMIIPLLFTGTSYGCIIKAILSLSSNIDRWKVFSTCGSHLSVVCIFYGTVIAIYVLPPKGFSLGENKAVPLLYTAVTPMLNPIIYSLRNKEIKNAITVLLQRQV